MGARTYCRFWMRIKDSMAGNALSATCLLDNGQLTNVVGDGCWFEVSRRGGKLRVGLIGDK
jgi:hypothetical protein